MRHLILPALVCTITQAAQPPDWVPLGKPKKGEPFVELQCSSLRADPENNCVVIWVRVTKHSTRTLIRAGFRGRDGAFSRGTWTSFYTVTYTNNSAADTHSPGPGGPSWEEIVPGSVAESIASTIDYVISEAQRVSRKNVN